MKLSLINGNLKLFCRFCAGELTGSWTGPSYSDMSATKT
ncbi:hypothetical protein HU200_066133 [Digitaria exilis]|uniref:Uncharacterized protein n=1 Tax=Digitaria exilis TaxID=1010633 RepID=A0A835DWV9_9POAL|nr:hypothetical protein HU200_066133 [Digitaria exilis]